MPSLALYRAGNVLVTNAGAGVTNLVYEIPPGGDDAYYARVTSSVRGLLAEYILDLNVGDTVPPFVTGTTLPLAGANIFTVFRSVGCQWRR